MLEKGLSQILERVYEQVGLEFRQYKETSLKRRVERRLRATKAQSYQHYTQILEAEPTEYMKLVNTLTVNVSEFFRNLEAWEILKAKILPELIEGELREKKTTDNAKPMLRIWCA